MTSLQDITGRLRRALQGQSGLDKTLKLDLRGDGVVFIEGAEVCNEDRPADCTVSVSTDDLVALAQGRLDPMSALMRGRMRVTGDMSVALRLQPILSSAKD
ncbi:MAG TPA: SCP2 sterol-binding domain-containing protein [Caulobacteraceae bacterium]|nr:SCP2 sterol-binding domain-containing protein [Caulobacteraceae bacterium]